MKYNGYNLPKITTEISDSIRLSELKATKERIKELKNDLETMLINRLEITEAELNIRYDKVFTVTVTFFEAWNDPVFNIEARVYDRTDYRTMFVDVITSEAPCSSICHRYEKVS